MSEPCKVCGQTLKEVLSWVHCPKSKSLICMDHCYQNCKHHQNQDGHCHYTAEQKRKLLV